jgi:hypothetical protein
MTDQRRLKCISLGQVTEKNMEECKGTTIFKMVKRWVGGQVKDRLDYSLRLANLKSSTIKKKRSEAGKKII